MPAKVFVLIPAFNVAPWLGEAIDSVIHQTFSDWELLILDDYSSDDTYKVAQSFEQKDSRIKVYRNDENLGMLRNWNKGIGYCRSDYFAKLDGDDYWEQTMLEKAVALLETQPNTGIVFSNYLNIDAEGNIEPIRHTLPEFARNKTFNGIDLVKQGVDAMLGNDVLRQGLGLIRFEAIQKFGPYRFLLSEKTQASTDTEFYFRIACHYGIHCIDEELYFYRIHQTSITSRDNLDGLAHQKLHENKIVINDYYYKQKKITASDWRSNKRSITFQNLLYQQYRARKMRTYGKALIIWFKLIVGFPGQITEHIFKRL